VRFNEKVSVMGVNMLWNEEGIFIEEPFDNERDLEGAIVKVARELFGDKRIYLDVKKKIGGKAKVKNIPDGYLIDLTSQKEPKLYVVENELAKHDPLKHISVQILEFSLSFETSPFTVKSIIKDALISDPLTLKKCESYASNTGLDNIDVLLEKIIYGEGRFNALVIIDELAEELEKVLISRFQFPVEILTLERYINQDGERIYSFQPFLKDVTYVGKNASDLSSIPPLLDPSEIDTIVVPARDDGFREVFLGEDRWYAIRIHSSMIPKIKYAAVYRVAPESAITHIAPVASIEQWKDTAKYILNFSETAKKIKPIKLVPKGKVRAPQAPRYTSLERLQNAKTLDVAF
jgi:hypothetical protein